MDNPALPSIREVLACDQGIDDDHRRARIQGLVKIGELAVKYGPHITSNEADTLRFLANTGVPVPKLYGFVIDPGTGKSFLYTEFIEGQNLERILPSLTEVEREDVFKQIQEALVHLRSLEPPNYIGSIGGKPALGAIFGGPAADRAFVSQDEMNEAIACVFAEREVPAQVNLVRECIKSIFQHHRTVFTHADLSPENIMVRTKGTKQDGHRILEIVIIDWELSGWYPEYWEFCTAALWGSMKPEWTEAVQNIMTIYPKELMMMEYIRRHVFFFD